jgi:hypothetical protein
MALVLVLVFIFIYFGLWYYSGWMDGRAQGHYGTRDRELEG